MADKKTQAELYGKLKDQMALGTGRAFELMALLGFLTDAKDPDISGSAWQYIKDFCPFKKVDGSLDKEQFEKRFREAEAYKVRHIYEPAMQVIGNDQGMHSDKWLYDHLNNDHKFGAVQEGLQRAFAIPLVDLATELENVRSGNLTGMAALDAFLAEKRQELLERESPEKTSALHNAARYFGLEAGIEVGKDKKYLNAQKQMKKTEPPYDKIQSGERNHENIYKVFSEADLSFLSNEEYRKMRDSMLEAVRTNLGNPGWTPRDPASRSVFEISTSLDGLGKELKDASGFRISDSSQFNAVKDRLEEIQKLVKKGSTKENREKLFQSMAKLDQECQAYLDKNAGERRTERGNRRKDIVGRLQQMAQDQIQKLQAPEIEQEMKKELAEGLKKAASSAVEEIRDSQYTKDMERLLVMNGEEEHAAKRQVLDAITAMGGSPERLEKMGVVLTKCRNAISQIDVRAEALKELGVKEPEKLTKKEMRGILSAPENQDKLNDFYTSLSSMAKRFSVEETHPGLQAVYRYMEVTGQMERNVAYERTSAALTKGLAGEAEWKKARKAYSAGDRSMDITEMAALKASLGVQRELIMENGTLSGQNRHQTEAMEDLAKTTLEIVKTDPKKENKPWRDYKEAADGLTLEKIFEENGRLTAMECAVAAAVGKNNQKVHEIHNRELGSARDMSKLSKLIHITPLDRVATNNNLLRAFMAMQGRDYTTAIDDPEIRKVAARDMKTFFESHGSELDQNGNPKTEKDRKNIALFADYFRAAHDMVRDYKVPDIDFADPIQRAAHKNELFNAAQLMIDIDQNMEGLAKIGAFQEAYGGKERFENIRMGLVKSQAMMLVGKNDNYMVKHDDLIGLTATELYGNVIAGKKIGQIAEDFKDVPKDTLMAGPMIFSTRNIDDADVYFSGQKKITLDRVIQSCAELGVAKESFQPLKDTLEKLKNEKQMKAESAKKKKLGQEKQPAVEKMNLNDLVGAEKKEQPRRKTFTAKPKLEKAPEQKERTSFKGMGMK